MFDCPRDTEPTSPGGVTAMGVVWNGCGTVVRRVTVRLRAVEGHREQVSMTDDSGVFVFRNVPTGSYQVVTVRRSQIGTTSVNTASSNFRCVEIVLDDPKDPVTLHNLGVRCKEDEPFVGDLDNRLTCR
jgi:hypothetical protein